MMKFSVPEGAHRRVDTMLVVALTVTGVATLSACTSDSADSFSVPTSSAVTADPTAVFDTSAPPEVRAVRHGSLVCFYTPDPDGDRLVFPDGYSASRNLELRDASGKVVATPGFAVGLTFSSASVTAPAVCGSSGQARAVARIEGLTG